jgi:ATP phosphoribosyltransferase regulatory subunit
LDGVALMLVLEGSCRSGCRASGGRRFAASTELSDGQLRFIGLTSMLIGLLLMRSCALLSIRAAFHPTECADDHLDTARVSIEDVLPAEARRVETFAPDAARSLRVHGYQLVMPPMIEYLESLLTGTGHDLDLRTFKLVDQLSGRLDGLRADITPQVARIDAHLLDSARHHAPRYCGTCCMRSRPACRTRANPADRRRDLWPRRRREPTSRSRASCSMRLRSGCAGVHLDLGHVGLFRAIANGCFARGARIAAVPGVAGQGCPDAAQQLTRGLDAVTRDALLALTDLFGGVEVIELEARRRFAATIRKRKPCLAQLEAMLRRRCSRASVRFFDLANCAVTTITAASCSPPTAARAARTRWCAGGRYDEVGKAFGRARPATGFSLDLRELARLAPASDDTRQGRSAPAADVHRWLQHEIARLRAAGEIVIVDLPGHEAQDAGRSTLARIDGHWKIMAAAAPWSSNSA